MRPAGEVRDVPLELEQSQILVMAETLKRLGVHHGRIKTGNSELEVVFTPSLDAGSSLTEEQRQLLLNNEATPEEMKAKLRNEYERDLYGASG